MYVDFEKLPMIEIDFYNFSCFSLKTRVYKMHDLFQRMLPCKVGRKMMDQCEPLPSASKWINVEEEVYLSIKKFVTVNS